MLFTVPLTEAEYSKLQQLKTAMGVRDLGEVMRAALDAFVPTPAETAAALAAEHPHAATASPSATA